MRKIIAAMISLSLVPATAAFAEKKKDQSADMGDSDRIICETVKRIGSRLGDKKTCHTAAEWAEMRRQQRMTTERVQGFKPCQVGAGPSGGDC